MRILAYDPSYINLGVAFGISSNKNLTIRSCGTYKIDKLLTQIGTPHDWELDDNQKRAIVVANVTAFTLKSFKPDIVVVEDIFYNGQNPNTLIIQANCLGTLYTQIGMHFINKSAPVLTRYVPNVIKAGVGVDKKDFKEKEAVKRQLKLLRDAGELVYSNANIDLDVTEDHTDDAVAMVYTKHREVKDELD